MIAIGLLVPIGYELNTAQYIVLYAAKYGSNFATNGWLVFNSNLTSGHLIEGVVAKPQKPEAVDLLRFMMLAHACKALEEGYMLYGTKPKVSSPATTCETSVGTADVENTQIIGYLVKKGDAASNSTLLESNDYTSAMTFFDNSSFTGNNGVAGNTTSTVKSFHHYHVEAEVKYLSNDSGDWDHCFYSVNGKQTKIADNASQGTYKVAFDVCCGDEYGFGVHTKDGVAGEDLMSVTRFRAWALPECAKQTCYPDCDGDGALSIDDFICFQTFFALGDNYADCDGDGALSIDDFICFQTYFAIGC